MSFVTPLATDDHPNVNVAPVTSTMAARSSASSTSETSPSAALSSAAKSVVSGPGTTSSSRNTTASAPGAVSNSSSYSVDLSRPASSSRFPTTSSEQATDTAAAFASSSAAASSSSAVAANSQTASQATSSHSWLTIGTFAGVVAGSFVTGAFIAGLFVFALLRKRSKRERHISQGRYVPDHDYTYSGGKASAMSTVTTLAEPSFLPQQTEDAEARRRILSLTDQIDQHVENFYHSRKVHVDGMLEAKISSYETQQMPNPLAGCFELATHPLTLIRHCLAFHMFSQTVAPGEDTHLILPTDIAGIVGAVYHKCLSPSTSRDTIAAFSMWKSLTGYLRPNIGRETTSKYTTSDTANRFARQFSIAFSSWSNPQYTEDQRIDHLAALVDHAIDTGTWLFQQPDSYKFNWNTLSHNGRNSTTKMMARETVVVPEVFKVTHMGALLSGQGQNVVQPVVRTF